MPTVRQPSFAGGELAPDYEGGAGVDLIDGRVAVGLKLCRNFFVTRTGRLHSRPGTKFVAAVKDSDQAVRLHEFIAGEAAGQHYVLEFGNLYVRFHSNGGTVTSGGAPYEVVTPYTTSQLARLKFAQSGDVLTITHPDHQERELVRAGHTSWSLNAIDYSRPAPEGSAFLVEYLPTPDATDPAMEWSWVITSLRRDPATGVVSESAPAEVTQTKLRGGTTWSATFTYPIGAIVESGGLYYESIQNNNLNHAVADVAWWTPYGLVFKPPSYFAYGGTTALSASKPVTLDLYGTSWSASADPHFLGFNIYRGRGGRYGWVGAMRESGSFVDLGETPDYTVAPPDGRNPFAVYDATGALTRTEEPVAGCYFEGRAIRAGTAERPATLWGSRVDDYTNHDERIPSTDDEAVELTLASRKREEIRSVVGAEPSLLVFTNSAVWGVRGASGPLSAAGLNLARVQSEVGASWLDPLLVDDDVLYVREKGSGVRALAYNDGAQKFAGGDLTLLAHHLVDGREIVDWAYQEDPWGIVWAVRGDGVLLSLTYSREFGIAAWAQHDTADGDEAFEGVACVPEGDMDAVYVVVRRTIGGLTKRYIERMTDRRVFEDTPLADVVCLDSAVSYDGSAATTLSGLDHLEGREVYALADGQVIGPLTVASGAVDISGSLPDGAAQIHVGLRYDCDAELLAIPGAYSRRKIIKTILWEVMLSRGLWTGEDFDALKEWRQRTVADGYTPPSAATETVVTHLASRYSQTGRAVVRQVDPLPLTILAVAREAETGD